MSASAYDVVTELISTAIEEGQQRGLSDDEIALLLQEAISGLDEEMPC